MNKDLDKRLCDNYPLIFAERHGNPIDTAMCWGFECGGGWFTLIDSLCVAIQNHIDATAVQNKNDSEYNEMATALKAGDDTLFRKHYQSWIDSKQAFDQKFVEERRWDVLETAQRHVTAICPQVVALQVKEKYGGLRFYYTGGDDVIEGMVSLAETLSFRTCEICGSPGKPRRDGWVRTLCDSHAKDQ